MPMVFLKNDLRLCPEKEKNNNNKNNNKKTQ